MVLELFFELLCNPGMVLLKVNDCCLLRFLKKRDVDGLVIFSLTCGTSNVNFCSGNFSPVGYRMY